ncbi:MAG: HepT-like ribonuclease domain-containing protein [Thermoleophilia bacterium]
MRRDVEWLADVLEAIDAIERYTKAGDDEFRGNELLQIWVVHHLQVIGEAAARLSPAIIAQAPDVPWSRIVGMRNVLVHEYFGIDLDVIWDTVVSDLPPMRSAVLRLLAAEEDA